jgi:hypothetical protein
MKYHKISPTKTKIIDPYNGGFIGIGSQVIVDSNRAEYYVAAGEAVYIEKDVRAPWEPEKKEEPAPVTKPTVGGPSEKTQAETKQAKANL